jgi:hypothetical protein
MTKLPNSFDCERHFERFMDAAVAVVDYVDSIFACATQRRLPIGRVVPEPIAGPDERKKLRDDALLLARTFTEYWMEHYEEMLTENDLAADDASMDRLCTGTVAMAVASLAETTAIAVGAFPEYPRLTALSFPGVSTQLLAQTTRPISQYGPSDLVAAIDALVHSWQRIKVRSVRRSPTFIVVKDRCGYILVRARAAVAIRRHAQVRGRQPPGKKTSVAGRRQGQFFPLATPVDRPPQFLTEPHVDPVDGTETRLVSLGFNEEMTQRFRALLDAAWVFDRHRPEWTHSELETALMNEHANRLRRHPPKRRRTMGPALVAAPSPMDPEKGSMEVANVRLRSSSSFPVFLTFFEKKDA